MTKWIIIEWIHKYNWVFMKHHRQQFIAIYCMHRESPKIKYLATWILDVDEMLQIKSL